MSANNWAVCPNCGIESWREDYDFFTEDGVVYIEYIGACSQRHGGSCGQKLRYEHTLTLPVVAP